MRRFSILPILLLLSSIAAHSEAAEQTAVAPGVSSCPGPSSPFAVYRIDLDTGDRTIISGRDDDCTLVGGGPEFFGNLQWDAIDVADDGRIVAGSRHNAPSGDSPTVYLVDPVSGDRVIASGCVDSSCSSTVGMGPFFRSFDAIALEPPPPPPAVAALPSWGLALLVGVLIGVTLRTSRSQKQLTA